MEKLFSSMSPEAAKFYHKIFNRTLLNIYAVRYGLFDILFCETEDPMIMVRWDKELPNIINFIEHKRD